MKFTFCKTIYAVLLFTVMIGCSDLLDKSPYGGISEVSYYKTESDAIGAVNSIYSAFYGAWSAGIYDGFYFLTSPIWSDEAEKGGGGPADGADLEEFNSFQIISSNGLVNSLWTGCYRGVFRANKAIEKIGEMDISNKDKFLGEAKFLRALYYYHLNIRWNGVPLINSTNTADFKTVARSSVKEIWLFVEQDLKDAINGLPVSYSNSDLGRPTKASAQGLLGRVYLFMKEWQKAADVYADIINSGNYRLMENYGDLFKNQGSDNLPESLFEIQSAAGKSTSALTITRFITPREVWSGYGFCVPTQSLADAFEPGDLRRPETLLMEGDQVFGIIYQSSLSPYTGYNAKKYMFGPETITDEADANFKEIRYAEILLGYAEAIMNGATEKANITGLQALNLVRKRAGLNGIASLSFGAIVHERQVELALEGFRIFDLVRWGIAKDVLGVNFDVNHDEYLPIPMNEILINPNLEQNPGY